MSNQRGRDLGRNLWLLQSIGSQKYDAVVGSAVTLQPSDDDNRRQPIQESTQDERKRE